MPYFPTQFIYIFAISIHTKWHHSKICDVILHAPAIIKNWWYSFELCQPSEELSFLWNQSGIKHLYLYRILLNHFVKSVLSPLFSYHKSWKIIKMIWSYFFQLLTSPHNFNKKKKCSLSYYRDNSPIKMDRSDDKHDYAWIYNIYNYRSWLP